MTRAVGLPWKVRAVVAAHSALTKAHVLPDSTRVLRLPVEKRLGLGPSKRMVGPVPEVSAEDRWVPTRDGAKVRVRVYRAADATDQPLLYFHGGGFAVGGIAACDHICRRLAHESGAVIVSVEYRLAPEHRFPGPLHDCLDAADWLVAERDELRVDPRKLVVGGDSAGGNLAAAVAVVFRDNGRPLAGQLLIYPAVDLSGSLPGWRAYRGVGLKEADLLVCAQAYLGDHDRTDPYASPWYADSAGLAPAFVLTVRHDALAYEGIAYAEKLLAAGVRVEHVDLDDHAHGSLSLPTLFRGVDDIYVRMSRFVRDAAAATG
jgi:acetyl esterase